MPWHHACDISDLPESGGREFVVEGRVIAIFRGLDEQIYAIDGMCAHQGGPLSQGNLDGNCLTCTWHGWQYDIRNGHNLLTHKKMLDVFQVEIREGQVWIELAS